MREKSLTAFREFWRGQVFAFQQSRMARHGRFLKHRIKDLISSDTEAAEAMVAAALFWTSIRFAQAAGVLPSPPLRPAHPTLGAILIHASNEFWRHTVNPHLMFLACVGLGAFALAALVYDWKGARTLAMLSASAIWSSLTYLTYVQAGIGSAGLYIIFFLAAGFAHRGLLAAAAVAARRQSETEAAVRIAAEIFGLYESEKAKMLTETRALPPSVPA